MKNVHLVVHLEGCQQCQVCFWKSVACHPKAKFWSERNEKQPRQVFKGSAFPAWFDCQDCHHQFETKVNRLFENIWCPYCCTPPQKLCDDPKCQSCFEKSFASHPRAQYWSEQNKISPRQVFKHSHDKYLFKCIQCDHQFEMSLSNISGLDRWCPFCSVPPKRLCDNPQCQFCFEQSFASHPKAHCWSDQNQVKPRQVFKSSNDVYHFICDQCFHKFDMMPAKCYKGMLVPLLLLSTSKIM